MRQNVAQNRNLLESVTDVRWVQIGGGRVMDEVEVDAELTARRKAQPGFVEASFPTIAGTHSLIFHNVSTSLFFGVKIPKFVCAVFKNWEKDQRPPFLSQQPQKSFPKAREVLSVMNTGI